MPQEYFLLRNVERVEQMTAKSQTIPAANGLFWAGSGIPLGFSNRAVSAGMYVTLYEGEITLVWYPVPISAWNEAAWFGGTVAGINYDGLVGKTNDAPFPPPCAGAVFFGAVSLFPAKAAGTLVMGQPTKEIIRMGNADWAFKVTIKMKYFPYGANSFFWWDRPQRLGGPGYHPIIRNDGTQLFPSTDFRLGFQPPPNPPN